MPGNDGTNSSGNKSDVLNTFRSNCLKTQRELIGCIALSSPPCSFSTLLYILTTHAVWYLSAEYRVNLYITFYCKTCSRLRLSRHRLCWQSSHSQWESSVWSVCASCPGDLDSEPLLVYPAASADNPEKYKRMTSHKIKLSVFICLYR